jgi:hypothetical protein
MTFPVQVRPCSNPTHRAGRLQLLGCALLGFAVVAAWNPVEHPGPRCCLMRSLFGLPCPLCGMTRGLAMCVRGRFLEATWYNPLAVPLFVLALVLCAKWAYEFITKRSVEIVLTRAWRTCLWLGVYAALLAAWAYLLTYRREDDFATTWLGQTLHFFRP